MLFRPKQSMIDGQVGDNYLKKFCSKDLSFVFWGSQNKRLTIHLYGLFFSFLFSVKFLQQSSMSAVLVNFFCTESLQPVWPQTCQLSLWFSLGLLVQGRMGHIMIISFTVYYLVLEIEMIHSGMKFSFNYVSMFGLNQLTSG